MSTARPDLSDFTADTSDFTPDTHPTQNLPVQPPGVMAGAAGALGSDLWGMIKGLPSAAISASPLSAIREALPPEYQQKIGFTPSLENIKAMAAADAQRKQAGYSPAYRAIAPLGELAGANVGGMEQSAQKGDVGGVLGHAAAVPTAMALTAGAGKVAGKYVGIRSRATQGFQNVEAKIGDQPVNHQPVLNTAYKAMEMGAKGFQLPKTVTDFVDWAKSVQASRTPFKFSDARDFYTALGEAIPWEQYGGKGGRMYTQVMKMRAQLGSALKTTANDAGMGDQYNRALQDYRTSARLVKGAKNVGSVATLGLLGKSMGLSGGDLGAATMRAIVNAGRLPAPAETIAPPPYPGMSSLDLENLGRGGNPGEQSAIRDALARAAEKARGNQYGGNPNATPEQAMQQIRQQRPDLFTGQSAPMNPPPSSGTPQGAAFETNVLKQVQAENPTWDIGRQLQEAAARAKRSRIR